MHHRKATTALAAGLALLVASLGGTSVARPAGAAAPVTLVLRYCWSGQGEVEAMKSIIDAWNSSQPDIQVRGISGSISVEDIAGGRGRRLTPDMVIMCNNEAVPGFAHDGVILPMDDLLAKIGADTGDIIPASLGWVSYGDKLYGLPFLQDDWGFYWNTDAFTEAGLDPTKPPTTLDELWDDAAKLTKRNADGSLARAGFIPDYPGKNLTETAELFGCKYYDAAAKKLTVNSPECVAWFDWYKTWYDDLQQERRVDDRSSPARARRTRTCSISRQGRHGHFGEWLPGAAYAPNFAPDPQVRDGADSRRTSPASTAPAS